MMNKLLRRSTQVSMVIAIGALAVAATTALFQLTKNQIAADIWRDRTRQLVDENQQLADRYNRAVRYSAVTELLVSEDSIEVVLRTPEGVLKTIPTDFDPSNEIHIDLILRNGRAWFRQVLEEPRRDGKGPLFIDPRLTEIDWTDPEVLQGQRVYHGGLTPGRWVVSVSGHGAMRLTRVDDEDASYELVHAPEVHDFAEIERDASNKLNEVSHRDVLSRIFGIE